MTYIEREALLEKLDAIFFATDPAGDEQIGVLKCRKAIRALPAADVAPVVRCRECKHWSYAQSLQRHECSIFNGAYNFIGYPTKDDDFCSYGEKRED